MTSRRTTFLRRSASRRRSKPGASAQRMDAQIRRREVRQQHRTARWAVPLATVAASTTGYLTAVLTDAHAGFAVAVTLQVLALCRIYRDSGSSWAAGAAGERRTGRLLAPLSWFGFGRWAVFHDLAIPGSRANIDHLLAGPAGIIMIDSKEWRARNAVVRLDRGGQLWYGRYPQADMLRTVLWEASRAAESLGHPVQAVIAVHHAPVRGGVLVAQGVTIIQANTVRDYLRSLPRQPAWNRQSVRRARRDIERQLRPAA